ncbi:MAG: class I SAM-dependent methyltransferase [Acidobacteriota bacterium]
MSLYDTPEGIAEYAAISDGIDGRELIDRLRTLIPARSRVLELGTGLGKDLEILAETFEVTGSDHSPAFLEHVAACRPEIPLLQLDARHLPLTEPFDAIYSNKVLHHLSRDQLTASLAKQGELLCPGGVLLHSLWRNPDGGFAEEHQDGLLFLRYSEAALRSLLPQSLEEIALEPYTELGYEDSLLLILRRP